MSQPLDGMALTPDQLARMTDRDPSLATHVVIHHTAEDQMNADITAIAAAEEAAFGFITIGYHFVVHGDGKIQVGRPIGKLPAANLGMNTESIAICCEGNFHPSDPHYNGEKPTDAQLRAVAYILNEWVKPKCHNLKWMIGHRDVARITGDSNDATACPGDLLYAKLHDLRVASGLHTPPSLT